MLEKTEGFSKNGRVGVSSRVRCSNGYVKSRGEKHYMQGTRGRARIKINVAGEED